MATVESIEVQYSRKVQLEQFEPIRHGGSLEVILEEDDDPDEIYKDYSDKVEDMVERALAKRIASKKIEAGEEEDE